jgi:SAM-dependent methyltransferase
MDDAAIAEMDALEDHHWWFVGKRLLVAALLSRLDTRGWRVLDAGCGTGGVLAHLGREVSAVGVDRSPRALAFCRRRGVERLVCAEGDRLPFRPASFDLVLLLDVLEHFADEMALLGGVQRLLRSGGRVLVSVPAFQLLWSVHDETLHHFRRYTAGRLGRVLEQAGFTLEVLTYTNVAALPPALVVRGLLARLGLRRAGTTDFGATPAWLGRILTTAYRMEAGALRRGRRLPLGLSVAALATTP